MTIGLMPTGAYVNPILAALQNTGQTATTLTGGNIFQNSQLNTGYSINLSAPIVSVKTGQILTPWSSFFATNPINLNTSLNYTPSTTTSSGGQGESQGFFDNLFSSVKNGVSKFVNTVTGLGKSIINTAAKYLGFNEKNGSYKKFTNGRTEAWCADFVTYIVKEAFRLAGKAIPSGFGSASVSGLMSWGKSNGRWIQTAGKSNKASIIKSQVKPGDIIIFKSSGASHTGIVESIASDGTIHTIEGNTSDKVARRTYSPNKATITGFIKMA